MAAQGIANAHGGGPHHPLEVVPQGIRSVEVDAAAGPGQPEAGQQARQAKGVVTVHVGDEDPTQLADPQLTAQELMLGALAAIKQPDLRPLRQAQGHR